jgi:hypothetical protein
MSYDNSLNHWFPNFFINSSPVSPDISCKKHSAEQRFALRIIITAEQDITFSNYFTVCKLLMDGLDEVIPVSQCLVKNYLNCKCANNDPEGACLQQSPK